MVEAVLRDRHLIIPASAYVQGQYGLNGIFFGVPVQLGRRGVEKIFEYPLNPAEWSELKKSAASVAEIIDLLR
jgi:malate dehydrogenase